METRYSIVRQRPATARTHSSFEPSIAESDSSNLRPEKPRQVRNARFTFSALYSLFRTIRFDILFVLIARLFGWSEQEEAKIAVYQHRPYATLHCILHVIPVVGAAILIHINLAELFVGYTIPWFGTGANQALAALQFIAKTHELFMLASIGSIAFGAVRSELVFGDGLPYGAIFAGQEVAFLNTLWSTNFWAVVCSIFLLNGKAKLHRCLLVALLWLSCILGALVGPFSANTMIPRWRDWPAGGTTYWVDATHDELFPTKIGLSPHMEHCTSGADDPACPYGGYEIIAQSFMSAWSNMKQLDNTPETIYLASREAERAMTFRDRSPTNGSQTIWANAFSLATVSPAAIADGLSLTGFLWAFSVNHAGAKIKRQWSKRDNAVYSVKTRQPLVMVYCNEHAYSEGSGTLAGSFANLASGGVNMKYNGDDDILHFQNVEITDSATLVLVQDYVEQAQDPGILWLDDNSLRGKTSSTLNAIAVLPESVLGHGTYYSCSIDTRYANVTLETATHSPKIIDGYPKGMESFATYNPGWKRFYPTPAWVDLLNADVSSTEGASRTTAFQTLISASGLWNNAATVEGAYAPYIVESALASLLANGVSRLSYNMSLAGHLVEPINAANLSRGGEWEDELLPSEGMGWGGNAYHLSAAEKLRSTEFTMRATASGYGYSWRGTAQLLGIVVLFTYIMLALGHIAYTILSGRYSTAWDSAAEIGAVMWNSDPETCMRNTGGGIRAISTLQQPVKLVILRDGCIRMVEPSRGFLIEANMAYR